MSDVGSHSECSGGGGGNSEEGEEGMSASQAENSEHESHPEGDTPLSALALAERVHRKLTLPDDEALPVAFHRSAIGCMVKLRDTLTTMSHDADRDVRLYILYAGIAVQRRIIFTKNTQEVEDLKVTMSLLYVLQVLCDSHSRTRARKRTRDGENVDIVQGCEPSNQNVLPDAPPKPTIGPDTEVLQKWSTLSVWTQMLEVEAEVGTVNSWSSVLRLKPDTVCRACCTEGPRMGQEATLASLRGLADTFFRCSSLTLAYNMLGAAELRDERESDFLTLDSVDYLCNANNRQEERLQAIVDAAETEAGQELLRDFILSFRLPSNVVGVRRTPLLTRDASRLAADKYPTEMQNAHEAAMRGAEWSWKHDKDKLHKACALLAGVCVLFSGRGAGLETIRKGDAFGGRVSFPFLETKAPQSGVRRLTLIPHRNEWIVYTIDKRNKPRVHLRHTGMEGLYQSALLLTSKSSKM